MAERLEIVISAKDKFSKAFLNLQNQLPSIKRLAIGAGVAFAGVGAAAAVVSKKFIDAASDFEETSNKFNVVFKNQTEVANKWAEELSRDFFMSKEESRRFLAAMQDLLVPMGLDAKAAGVLSNEIVKLSADLGSFNNLPTEQVMRDIQSALVGNYETVKKYGVVLTATAVQQRALKDGLAESKEELTAADKAMTAYKIITEASQAAVGDMARSSGSYANQMKRLHARVKDVSIEIGEKLLPVATDLVGKVGDWIEANDKLLKQDIPQVAGEIASNLGTIVQHIGSIAKYAGLRSVMDTFAEGTRLAKEGFIDWDKFVAASFTERQRMVDDFYERHRAGREDFDTVNAAIEDQKDHLIAAEAAANNLKKTFESMGEMDFVATDLDQMFSFYDEQMAGRLGKSLESPLLDNTKNDIAALKDLWNQYYLDESGRINAWYESMREKHKENADALAWIDEIYQGKKIELALSEQEQEAAKLQAIRDLHSDHFATEFEKLNEWYTQQQEQYAGQQEALAMIDEIFEKKKAEMQEAQAAQRLAVHASLLRSMAALTGAFGKKGFKLAQAFSIAEATMMSLQAFNNALANTPGPPPLPQIAAAAALAMGLAQVAKIAAQKPPSAHGGLTSVPREQTYLLDRGERVVSPAQNKDLTEFIKTGGGGFTITGDLILEINAPSPIQDMGKNDWRDLAEDNLIPALNDLANSGIKVRT